MFGDDMTMQGEQDISAGQCVGKVAPAYAECSFVSSLEAIPYLVRRETARAIRKTRNRNVRITLEYKGRKLPVMVKAFGRRSPLKDAFDARRGSRARRSWNAALFLERNRVGTPPPVCFLERWSGPILLESYFVTEFQENMTTFKDELIRLFRSDPECGRFMTLFQTVAEAISAMHEAGFLHNDLGNQNIMLRNDGPDSWSDVQFVDLNRSRTRGDLSARQRARDISRISLPSDFLRVFKEMYCAKAPQPDFQKWESFYRRMYRLHSATRKYRHPLRTSARGNNPVENDYPHQKDMWVWDSRSVQPVNALVSRDRRRHQPWSSQAEIIGSTACAIPAIRREYRKLMEQCWRSEIDLKDRVGVSIEHEEGQDNRRIQFLEPLGPIPVMVRFYHHKGPTGLEKTAGLVRCLREHGHPVSIALTQDRNAVRNPAGWTQFVREVLRATCDNIEYAEVGHAVNRVKWGIWSIAEYRNLMAGLDGITREFQGVRFTGPAAIDFEYPFVQAALDRLPRDVRLAALSHHLYVDRRGAPENRQGPFSTLEKLALARAIAATSKSCEDKLIISEVNWPITGTGVYSPVNSPYESPGPRFNDPSVTEDQYADYMIRYLLIALCSGMADRVYWWRLVSRGFGLVDDSHKEWRARPAYTMLRFFLSAVEGVKFRRKPRLEPGAHGFVFGDSEQDTLCVAYTQGDPRSQRIPFEFSRALDAFGNEIDAADEVRLSGRPVYLFR